MRVRDHIAAGVETVFRVLAVAVLLGAVGTLSAYCTGCGASAREQHATLNRLTEIADPTYAAAVDGCDVFRDAIVSREGTTYDEDMAAMTEINAVCDPIVLGFESLRGSQLTARAAIDAGAEGAIQTAILEALRLWARLQTMATQLSSLGRTGQTADPGGAQ